MSNLKPTRAATAVAIAAISATLLTGCFGNPVEDLVNRGVEDAIEGATGGDVSLGGELPADFPTSVPLIDGTIGVAAGTGGADGWVVVITSSASDPVADAAAALEGAGFTEDTTVSGAGMGAKVYSNAEYLVLVAGEGETVSYTVTPKP
ncbi:MAG TPA: hypothetical protein VFM66_02415 [Agromyces sp.]|nr:hypothetical protein [Agromyces sp.]